MSMIPGQSVSNFSSEPRKDISDLLEAAAQASIDNETSEVSGDDLADDADVTAQSHGQKKRSRACEKCRSQKVRCKPVPGSEVCQACTKMNRPCIMPVGPPRKRQRTVQKVQELEKKIDALTQSLLAKTRTEDTPQNSPSIIGSGSNREAYQDSPVEPPTYIQSSRQVHSSIIARINSVDNNYEDAIDRGLLSLMTARKYYSRFMTDLNPLCPLINFPKGTTFDMIRRTRPMLTLAILSVGCTETELGQDLSDDYAKELATRAFFYFERSVDILQSILIHTTWMGKHR